MNENRNLRYKLEKSQIVYKQKNQKDLDFYFKYYDFFDSATIENFWQSTKLFFCKYAHWNNITTNEMMHKNRNFATPKFKIENK